MREQFCLNISRLVIFVFIFGGCTCLFFIKPVVADGGKTIKIHPNAQKEPPPSVENLKAKAEEYNQQAIGLFEDGRYAEAQELWEKAIHLTEHPRAARLDLEVAAEDQQSLESLEVLSMDESPEASFIADKYQSGLSLLEQKEYGEAQRVFQEIDAVQPGYRNTKKYLVVIDELLREESAGQIGTDQQEYPSMAQESDNADIDSKLDDRSEEAQLEEAVADAEQKLEEQIVERVEPTYQRALQQYKSKDYAEARRSFEEVQVLSPDYKLASKYLDGIDDDILNAQQQQEEEQRLTEERARRQDEQEFRKTVAAKEGNYQKELDGKAEEIYQQAIADFKDRKLEEAEDSFRKADAVVSGYKLTDKYLERIEQLRDDEARLQAEEESRRQALMEHAAEEDMNRTIEESERLRQQELRERTEVAYQGARTYYGQWDLAKALASFSEVERISPDYRSVRKYLVLIKEDMASEQDLEQEMPYRAQLPGTSSATADVSISRKRQEAEQYYRQAKELYKKREFDKARGFFQKVDALVRGYQATEKFLARIDADIQKEAQYQQSLQQREARRQGRDQVIAQKRTAVKETAAKRRQETRDLRETAVRIKSDRDKMVSRKVKALYREAESDYKNNLYALAKVHFDEVQRICPGYESTNEYLAQIAYEYGSEEVIQPTPAAPAPVMEEVLPAMMQVEVAPVQREVVPVEREVAPAKREILPVENIVAPAEKMPDDEAALAYDTGISLFKRRQYVPAREKFEYVAQVYPDYKSTHDYLSRINSLLQREEQRQLQEQQQALARAVRKEKLARKSVPAPVVETVVVSKPEASEDSATPAVLAANEQPKKEDEQIQLKAQGLFQEAVQLYASNQFVPARAKFLELEQVSPGYQTTPRYLEWIERAMVQQEKTAQRLKQKQDREAAHRAEKEKMTEKIAQKKQKDAQRAEEKKRDRLIAQAAKKYAQAVAFYEKKNFIAAKQKFGEVAALHPNFKETVQYLGRVDADIAAANQKPKEVTTAPIYVQSKGDAAAEQARLKAAELFDEAVRLYTAHQFVPARDKFREAEKQVPGYRTTLKYIELTEQAILKQERKGELVKQKREARNARLKMDAQKLQERTEKIRQENEGKKAKPEIARMEKEIIAANKREDWDIAEQKLSGLEKFLENEPMSTTDKQQTVRRVADLRESITAGRGEAQRRQQEKEQAAKQRQDRQNTRLEAKAQKVHEQTERIRQDNERRQQQAQAKSTPVNVPAPEPVWVKPPDFGAIDLSQNAEALRAYYAQIQRERRNVQTALAIRIDQLYSWAVQLYNQGYYAGAKNLFNEIAAVQPAFKGTKSYLGKIDQKFAKLPAASAMPESGIVAPSVHVKTRVQVVTDTLNILETSR